MNGWLHEASTRFSLMTWSTCEQGGGIQGRMIKSDQGLSRVLERYHLAEL